MHMVDRADRAYARILPPSCNPIHQRGASLPRAEMAAPGITALRATRVDPHAKT